MEKEENLLEIRELSVQFASNGLNIVAVNRVSFVVKKAETFALIGESGSGKSVIGMAILRLLPDTAKMSGKIIFEGRDITKLSEEELKTIRGKEISWIPQNQGSSLNPTMKVGAQIEEVFETHIKIKRAKLTSILKSLFQRLDLTPPEKRLAEYPFQYSGGMKQRALIALGISLKPKLIIADEPTKGIDKINLNYLAELFERIKEKSALLLITHDLSFAEKVADKVGVMYCGEIIEISDKGSFFESPLHPYSRGLLKSLPSRGMIPIKGSPPSPSSPPKGCRFHPRCHCLLRLCKESEPPLTIIDGHRMVRCWLYAGTP